MRVMHVRCAGLDVHKKTITVCSLVGEAGTEPRMGKQVFGTSTSELLALSDWLQQQQVTHVAMESTGTYWKPVWAILEGHFDLTLCNAAHIKQVPGRKTDQKDAEWIADLLRHGLLKKSYVPPQPQQDLRELTRYRAQVTGERSAVANRIGKELEGANIKLASVATDIMGVSGRRMLQAMVDGETDPVKLADLALGALKDKRLKLIEALTGRLRDHHRRMLKLLLAQWMFLDRQLKDIEAGIGDAVRPFLAAVELIQTIPGIKSVSACAIIAEIGPDMEPFANRGHLSGWAGMCPGNNESAGKHYSGKTRSGNRWLKRVLTQVGWAAARSRDCYFAALFRRLAARRDTKRALVAVGHSILDTIYGMLKSKRPYQDLGPLYFDQLKKEQVASYCVRKLQSLGFRVVVEAAA